MRRPFVVLALGLCCLPTWALAQAAVKESNTAPSVSKFVMGTRLGYITCSDKYRSYLEKWELYALVTEGQKEPQGSPPADSEVADCVHQTALRGSEYMVAWDASLKGIRKPERETVQQYRVRQKQVEDKLNGLQSKLEAAVPSS